MSILISGKFKVSLNSGYIIIIKHFLVKKTILIKIYLYYTLAYKFFALWKENIHPLLYKKWIIDMVMENIYMYDFEIHIQSNILLFKSFHTFKNAQPFTIKKKDLAIAT